MCGLILELLLLELGLWAVVSGKLPSAVFGKKHRIEGWGARLIGGILMLPLPLSVVAGAIFILLLNEEQAEGYVNAAGIVILLLALMAAWFISRFVRRPVESGISTPTEPAGVDFSPRLPSVEPMPAGLAEFAWNMAIDSQKRELVIMTPGRGVITSGTLPTPETLPPEMVADLESIAPSGQQWRIAAIGMTQFDAFQINAYQAVPFLTLLEGLVQSGHAVILFEGHISALVQICRGADLLIIDSELVPFLHPDWQASALSVMNRPNIIKVNRKGTEILGLQRWESGGVSLAEV